MTEPGRVIWRIFGRNLLPAGRTSPAVGILGAEACLYRQSLLKRPAVVEIGGVDILLVIEIVAAQRVEDPARVFTVVLLENIGAGDVGNLGAKSQPAAQPVRRIVSLEAIDVDVGR